MNHGSTDSYFIILQWKQGGPIPRLLNMLRREIWSPVEIKGSILTRFSRISWEDPWDRLLPFHPTSSSGNGEETLLCFICKDLIVD